MNKNVDAKTFIMDFGYGGSIGSSMHRLGYWL
jgi:hypothetical protein